MLLKTGKGRVLKKGLPEGGNRLLFAHLGRGDRGNYGRLCISAQTVLQQPGQLGIPVVDVHVLVSAAQLLDHLDH